MTARVNRPHLPKGRVPRRPVADAAQRIEALAADGFSLVGIARSLGTGVEVLHRWLEEDPALQEAFEAGRESERQVLHNMLFKAAVEKGNIVAAFFLLKCRHGYREGDQSDSANRVSVTFNLPGALSPIEFLKVIDEQPANKDQPVPAKSISGP